MKARGGFFFGLERNYFSFTRVKVNYEGRKGRRRGGAAEGGGWGFFWVVVSERGYWTPAVGVGGWWIGGWRFPLPAPANSGLGMGTKIGRRPGGGEKISQSGASPASKMSEK